MVWHSRPVAFVQVTASLFPAAARRLPSKPVGGCVRLRLVCALSSVAHSQAQSPALTYDGDLPYVTLPPQGDTTATRPVRFRVHDDRPIGSLLTAIQEEDPTVLKIHVLESPEDSSPRWARSTLARDVLGVALKRNGLVFCVNDHNLQLTVTPYADRAALIDAEIREVDAALAPIQSKKSALDRKAHRRGVITNWLGLA
ncbi:hypothetical protein HK405_005632, partial [Cladochytrium tenue]